MQTLGKIIAERRQAIHKSPNYLAGRKSGCDVDFTDRMKLHVSEQLALDEVVITGEFQDRLRLHEHGLLVFDSATEQRLFALLDYNVDEIEALRDVPRALPLHVLVRRRRQSLQLSHKQLVQRINKLSCRLHAAVNSIAEAALTEHELEAYERREMALDLPLLYITLLMLDYSQADAEELVRHEHTHWRIPDDSSACTPERLTTVMATVRVVMRDTLLRIAQDYKIREQPEERKLVHAVHDPKYRATISEATLARILSGSDCNQGVGIVSEWGKYAAHERPCMDGPAHATLCGAHNKQEQERESLLRSFLNEWSYGYIPMWSGYADAIEDYVAGQHYPGEDPNNKGYYKPEVEPTYIVCITRLYTYICSEEKLFEMCKNLCSVFDQENFYCSSPNHAPAYYDCNGQVDRRYEHVNATADNWLAKYIAGKTDGNTPESKQGRKYVFQMLYPATPNHWVRQREINVNHILREALDTSEMLNLLRAELTHNRIKREDRWHMHI